MTVPGKSQKVPAKISLDLLSNAKDSLAHAVTHLTDGSESSPGQWKIAIREVAHVIELLLKERLRRAHPALVWAKVDEYPSLDARTVGTDLAASRLAKMCGVILVKGDLDTLEACRKLRNRIEHYEFQVEEAEARAIVGRMLAFIFAFSKKYLDLDLEAEFRKDDSWETLIELVEFREAQAAAIARRFSEDGTESTICDSCGEPTFDIGDEKCALCGHRDQLIDCDQCGQSCWESELESFDDPESGETTYVCRKCVRDAERADYDYDVWKDSQAAAGK